MDMKVIKERMSTELNIVETIHATADLGLLGDEHIQADTELVITNIATTNGAVHVIDRK